MAVVSNKSGVKTPPKLDSVLTMKPTARVERIRDAFFSLKATPSIDRARVETKVMRETEGEPMGIRRAKSFAAMAREIPIEIYPDELLMGYSHIKPRALSIVPSAGLEARMEAGREYTPRRSGPADQGHDMPDLSTLSDEEKRELKEELIPYWKGKGKIMKPGGYGHNIVDYEKVLQKGFLGIKKEAEERLAGLDLAEPGGAAKVQFLESAVMVLEAASEFGKRYAALARERAEGESDPARKADLLRVAEVCDWVPANPARNFYEAVQSCYFAWLLTCWENSLVGGQSLGRMDQYLYPYYDDDMKEERITNEEALELIDCLLFKVNHGPPVAAISVGGVGPNGHDVTNPLSYMFIEGMMHTRLRQPYFSVQVHQ
ncbi:MAG: pyruvate formate lyase family protein, partial [Candidatus Hydrogenedentes bacterium]|nr:pyruvate formate lyase family protein [Candidatus Hydrogenedentota bacterium]